MVTGAEVEVEVDEDGVGVAAATTIDEAWEVERKRSLELKNGSRPTTFVESSEPTERRLEDCGRDVTIDELV